jgi:hypothetical protein
MVAERTFGPHRLVGSVSTHDPTLQLKAETLCDESFQFRESVQGTDAAVLPSRRSLHEHQAVRSH